MGAASDEDLRQKLLEKLGETEARLKFHEAEVLRLKRVVGSLKQLVESMFAQPVIRPGEVLSLALPPAVRRVRIADMTLKEAVRTILEERSEPMFVREIYEALVKAGKAVGGKKPPDTVRAILSSNEDTFIRTEGSTKWTVIKSEIARHAG